MKSRILGIALMLAGLWGGSYCIYLYPPPQIFPGFPAILTAIFFGIIGFLMFIAGDKLWSEL